MVRFVIFGFSVHIHWFFWISMAFLGGVLSMKMTPESIQGVLMFMLAGFISILLHELGHAWTMRAFGGRAAIVLHSFGGYAVSDKNFTRLQHILISLAGPVIQVLLGFAFLALLMHRLDYHSIGALMQGLGVLQLGTFDMWITHVIWVSFVWGILNLIPIFPMDGGQVLFFGLGPKRQKFTYAIGILLGALLVWYFISSGLLFGSIMAAILTFENFKRIKGEPVGSVLFPR